MLIFELQDNNIKLAQRLEGTVLATEPGQYVYFLDYLEFKRLAMQIKRLRNNPDAIVDNELYRMIASSFVVTERQYVLYVLFDTPYCVMWLPTNKEQIMQVVNAAVQLAGRICDAKRKV